jgi:hypothetical protein
MSGCTPLYEACMLPEISRVLPAVLSQSVQLDS